MRNEGESSSRREKTFVLVGSISLAALVGIIFFLLLSACGFAWLPGFLRFAVCFGTPEVRISAADIVDDLGNAHRSIQDEIAALQREIGRIQCLPEAKPEPEPEFQPEPEPKPEERADLDPEPIAECEPTQKQAVSEEIIFVFDTSGSMGFPADLPLSMERGLTNAWNAVERAKNGSLVDKIRVPLLVAEHDRLMRQARNMPGEKRIDVAKKVTIDAIQGAPGETSIGLVSFQQCSARPHGSFAPPQRPSLIRTVRGLSDDDSTPLAESITQAAWLLSGGRTTDAYANMVVISDGEDSCGGDPCIAARRAKARKPGLVINVIDLSNSGNLKCVSSATGGFYKRRNEGMDLSELSQSVREAAGYEGEGLCRN